MIACGTACLIFAAMMAIFRVGVRFGSGNERVRTAVDRDAQVQAAQQLQAELVEAEQQSRQAENVRPFTRPGRG